MSTRALDLQGKKIPRNVAKTLRSLLSIDKKIDLLEAQVVSARSEKERLENDLAKYLATVAPIRRLPAEVLTMIFEEYVRDQPTHIRRLLLVCRLWNTMVSNAAHLWTYVRVTADSTDLAKADSFVKYVKTCYERSRGALMNVYIDYSDCLTQRKLLETQMSPLFIIDWENGSYYSFEAESPLYDIFIKQCQEVIKFLVGEEGVTMGRLKSLRMSFYRGNPDLTQSIWSLFTGEAPNLVELIVENFQLSFDVDSFPSLPSLKSFKSTDLVPIKFSRSPLESLEIRFTGELENYTEIFTAHSLRSLTLYCGDWRETVQLELYRDEASVKPPTREKHALPVLESLTIDGTLPFEVISLLSFPALQSLTLRNMSIGSPMDLPKASPSTIEYVPYGEDGYLSDETHTREEAIAERFKDDIYELLVEYNSVNFLIINEGWTTPALSAIREAITNGICHRSPTIRVINDSGEIAGIGVNGSEIAA